MSVLPCASAPVHCRLITAHAHAQQNVKAAPILLGAVCGRRRSVGNAPWRSRGPAQLAGCLEEPGLCLRVDSGGGCRRSGRILAPGFCIWMPGWASRDGPQAKEESPVQWKNMQASGVASWGALGGRWCCVSLAWLVLPFFPPLLVLLDRNTTRGTWPPPTRPGGEWRGRGKPSSKSLSRDLLSKASMLAFSSPVCAPLFSDIQRRPLSACLSACGLSMCTGGRHPRRPHVPHAGLLDRRDPASVHSTEHCLVADFLFSCTWQEKKPTTNNGDRHSRRPKRGALQRRCRSGGGGPPSPPAAANSLCFVLGRGCVRLCPPSHPAGRLGWAGLGVVCLRGRRAVVAEVAPTTHNQSSSA